jgi:protein-tyrosine kinase
MGKIFDALERSKEAEEIKTDPLSRPAITGTGPLLDALAHPVRTSNGFSPKLVVVSAPDSVDAESFKALRARVIFPKDGKPARTIMVTSAFPSEGKTHVAANLAASIAMGVNQHVLLVDTDFRHPNLHSMFGHANEQGLCEYLTGKRILPELLLRTKMEKLSLLPAGRPGPDHAELLSSAKMKHFLQEVKARYQDRYIIVDAAPSHVTAEAGVLSHHVDGIIYVVMAQKTPRGTVQRGIDHLGREKVLGIVFNGYSESYRSYHKYYKNYHRQNQ